jgi:probable rRNA maturation factor
MKIKIELGGQLPKEITLASLEKITRKTFQVARFSGKKYPQVAISLSFVSGKAIQGMNRQFRKRDEVTDILSFSYQKEKKVRDKNLFLGEIIICASRMRRDVKADKQAFSWYFAYILSHGLLHLLGREHSQAMFSLQEKIAESFS